MNGDVLSRHGDPEYIWEAVPDRDSWHKYCFFCAPNRYPRVPDGTMLCSCCGAHYVNDIGETQEEWMLSMYVCGPCEIRLEEER